MAILSILLEPVCLSPGVSLSIFVEKPVLRRLYNIHGKFF